MPAWLQRAMEMLSGGGGWRLLPEWQVASQSQAAAHSGPALRNGPRRPARLLPLLSSPPPALIQRPARICISGTSPLRQRHNCKRVASASTGILSSRFGARFGPRAPARAGRARKPAARQPPPVPSESGRVHACLRPRRPHEGTPTFKETLSLGRKARGPERQPGEERSLGEGKLNHGDARAAFSLGRPWRWLTRLPCISSAPGCATRPRRPSADKGRRLERAARLSARDAPRPPETRQSNGAGWTEPLASRRPTATLPCSSAHPPPGLPPSASARSQRQIPFPRAFARPSGASPNGATPTTALGAGEGPFPFSPLSSRPPSPAAAA